MSFEICEGASSWSNLAMSRIIFHITILQTNGNAFLRNENHITLNFKRLPFCTYQFRWKNSVKIKKSIHFSIRMKSTNTHQNEPNAPKYLNLDITNYALFCVIIQIVIGLWLLFWWFSSLQSCFLVLLSFIYLRISQNAKDD